MTPASRLRSATVWALVTVATGALALVLLADLVGLLHGVGPGTAVEHAVVAVCEVLLLVCLIWAWAATTAVVVDLLRAVPARRVRGVPRAWRRLVLLACGGALGVGVAVPAHAAGLTDDHPGPGGPAATATLLTPRLDGLPLPRRPVDGPVSRSAPASRPAPAAPAPGTGSTRQVVVRPGDTLWAIAAADLGPGTSTTAVARHCEALYRLNAPVVGADADLVLPGQRLDLPPPHQP